MAEFAVVLLVNGQEHEHIVSGPTITTPAQALTQVKQMITRGVNIPVEWDDHFGDVRLQGLLRAPLGAGLRVTIPWPASPA